MRSKIILCLRTAWVVAALMILWVGPNICTSLDKTCTATDGLLFLMGLLTFPCGVVVLLVTMILFEVGSSPYPSSFFFWWLVLAGGGSVQWLIVIPELIADQGPISLNLETLETKAPRKTSTRPTTAPLSSSPVKSKPDSSAHEVAAPLRIPAKARRRGRKGVRPFDKSGHTPLERVIHRL